jgi:hypothetical protein
MLRSVAGAVRPVQTAEGRKPGVGAICISPFESIAIEAEGNFPQSDQKNGYLLITMDYFTKSPEAYAIPTREASTMTEALVTNFYSRFGVPRELHSDQGRNFESRLMQEIAEMCGSEHDTHPTPAPAVRRYGGTVRQNGRGAPAGLEREARFSELFASCLSNKSLSYLCNRSWRPITIVRRRGFSIF